MRLSLAKCPKVTYRDFVTACLALADVQRRAESGEWRHPGETGKMPQRVYRCDRCGWWHLTSKERADP